MHTNPSSRPERITASTRTLVVQSSDMNRRPLPPSAPRISAPRSGEPRILICRLHYRPGRAQKIGATWPNLSRAGTRLSAQAQSMVRPVRSSSPLMNKLFKIHRALNEGQAWGSLILLLDSIIFSWSLTIPEPKGLASLELFRCSCNRSTIAPALSAICTDPISPMEHASCEACCFPAQDCVIVLDHYARATGWRLKRRSRNWR